MNHEYLMKEYKLCFQQLRFYDKREESVLKYLISLASTVAAAHFAIYKFLLDNRTFFTFQFVMSGLVFFATLLLFLATLQNRLYFVRVARQLNAIRKYFMCIEKAKNGFTENQMYVEVDWKALSSSSLHTYIILGSALISSLFGGASVSAIRPAFYGGLFSLITAGVATIILLAVELAFGIVYLYFQSPDKPTLECPDSAKKS
jgi:hypothetical protein